MPKKRSSETLIHLLQTIPKVNGKDPLAQASQNSGLHQCTYFDSNLPWNGVQAAGNMYYVDSDRVEYRILSVLPSDVCMHGR